MAEYRTSTLGIPLEDRLVQARANYLDDGRLEVEVDDPSLPHLVFGTVTPGGRLERFSLRARQAGEISASDLRTPGLVQTLRQAAILMQMAAPGGVMNMTALPAEGRTLREAARRATRAASRIKPKRPGRRVRGAAAEALVEQVAVMYREQVAMGNPSPRQAIKDELGYSPEYIGRLLVKARRHDPPLLGPAVRGKAGEDTTTPRKDQP